MPYEMSWIQENQILLIELIGTVTTEEIEKLTEVSFEKVTQSSRVVHAIIDQQRLESMPFKLKNLTDSIKRNVHPNQGITVLVSPQSNKVYRFLGSMIFQMMGWEYRMASSMEEALSIIAKVDTQ